MRNSTLDHYISRLIKESKPDLPLWNIEAIKSGKKPAWNYIDGCMMSSLLDLYQRTNDAEYLEFVDSFVDYYVFDDGSIRGYSVDEFNLDNINEGRVLFDLYRLTGKEKYRLAIDTLYQQIKTQPRTYQGNFWHKKIYPNQVWLDGLYMAQPFYAKYEVEFNNSKNIEDILTQFETVFKEMFNTKDRLYYHGYDASKTAFWCDKNTGLSQNYWLRSIGWYTIALVDVYSIIEDQNSKNRIKAILAQTIEGVYTHLDQDENMFYQVPNFPKKEGNYLETSGSAMIAYASLKGSRIGAIDSKYRELGLKVFQGITKKYLKEIDGQLNLEGICLVAGLGPENNLRRDGSYAYYISEPVVKNDAKGVGPLIMAYTEVLKLD